MARVVEYMLHIGADGALATPPWIAAAGHFPKGDGTLIGTVRPGTYYLPETLVEMTAETLTARALALHALHPMTGAGNQPLTPAEVEAMAAAWWAEFSAG
jgi:hypothetical protein